MPRNGREQQPSPVRDHYEDWVIGTGTFERADFNGFLDSKSAKFDATGAFSVTFIIPPGQVDKALPLRHLIRNQFPVTISISVLEDFLALRASRDSHTAA